MIFPERVCFQKALKAYKIINNKCPKYLQNYFTFTYEIYSKNLRSAEKFSLYIPKPNVEIFCKTFAYSFFLNLKSICIYHSIYTILFVWCTAISLHAHGDPTAL